MNKSKLRQLVKEAMGYSKYAPGGTTKGGTTADFRGILTAIVNDRPEDKQEGDMDLQPQPHEELHGYSQKTTPEGEHETWAVYFDPKTNTYNERHRVPEETVFGKNAKIRGNVKRGNEILNRANPDNVDRITRGEKPIYEGEGKKYKVEYWYRSGGEKDFDTEEVTASSAEEAIEKAKAQARRGAIDSTFKVVQQ